MTDITELTQREKFEAWLSPRWSMEKFIDDDGEEQYVEDYVQGAWMGFSAANTELVEALEKAQQYSKERDAENQDLMLTVGRLRVEREELESRTVKLPEAFYPDGDIDCPLAVNVDDVKDVLTAAGIKWEAE